MNIFTFKEIKQTLLPFLSHKMQETKIQLKGDTFSVIHKDNGFVLHFKFEMDFDSNTLKIVTFDKEKSENETEEELYYDFLNEYEELFFEYVYTWLHLHDFELFLCFDSFGGFDPDGMKTYYNRERHLFGVGKEAKKIIQMLNIIPDLYNHHYFETGLHYNFVPNFQTKTVDLFLCQSPTSHLLDETMKMRTFSSVAELEWFFVEEKKEIETYSFLLLQLQERSEKEYPDLSFKYSLEKTIYKEELLWKIKYNLYWDVIRTTKIDDFMETGLELAKFEQKRNVFLNKIYSYLTQLDKHIILEKTEGTDLTFSFQIQNKPFHFFCNLQKTSPSNRYQCVLNIRPENMGKIKNFRFIKSEDDYDALVSIVKQNMKQYIDSVRLQCIF